MNNKEQFEDKSEEGVSSFSPGRLIVGVIVMIVVLIIAKFSPEISGVINRLLSGN